MHLLWYVDLDSSDSKTGDFCLNDKRRSGGFLKCVKDDSEKFLDENSAQTQKRFVK